MRTFLSALFLICACNIAHAEEFTARVIAVMDGDTVRVLRNGHSVKIRLAGIDAPEGAQEYGMASRQSLAELVLRKQVQVNIRAVDNYGRLVADISVDGLNVNHEQVRRGWAWNYLRFRSTQILGAMENEAKAAKRGLWAQSTPTPPWQWRKTHAATKPPQPAAQDATYGSKARCAQMSSCAEANFYLTHCGVKTLDGDGDGIPSENLCGAKE